MELQRGGGWGGGGGYKGMLNGFSRDIFEIIRYISH